MIFFWTIGYGLAYILPVFYAGSAWVTSICMSIYILLLITWLIGTRRTAFVRLHWVRPTRYRDLSDLLPLLILPICNLPIITPPPPSVVLLMICVSIAEELLFRGVLLRFFQRLGNFRSILVTAIIFALFHGVNLITGSNVSTVLVQIFCAAGAGFLFGAITLKWNSILPAISGHILANVTGIGSMANPRELMLYTTVCALWGIWIYKSIRI